MPPLRYGDEVLGLIPARGGSKSVPLKNLAPLNGWPLIRYVVEAGRRSVELGRLFCSTDDHRIAQTCSELGVGVIQRPPAQASDDAPVIGAILHALEVLKDREGVLPWAVVLLQPTSPFTLPGHIDAVVQELRADKRARSAQCIAEMPPNHHAFSQRITEGPYVRFRYPRARARCFRKQLKPCHYILGTAMATRTSALFSQRNVFATPSRYVEIPSTYALDVDGPLDFKLAQLYLDGGLVELPERR